MANELAKEKTMTTKEVAEKLKTSPTVVLSTARKCLPNKRIENGKPTLWTTEEAAMIVERMKEANNNQYTFNAPLKVAQTPLTVPNLLEKASKAANTIEQQMEIANAGMQALAKAMAMLKGENTTLKEQNVELKHQVEFNKVIGFHGWRKTKTELGIKMNFKTLVETYNLEEEIDYFEKCMGMDKRPTKLISPRVYEMLKSEVQANKKEEK